MQTADSAVPISGDVYTRLMSDVSKKIIVTLITAIVCHRV